MKITKDKAEELLRKDLEEFSSGVSKLLKFVVAQHEFDALVSLAYNIGISAFKRSTLLKLLNGKNFTDAAEQFLKWNKAKGKVLAGLKRRRQAERHLFLTGTLKFNFA
jgi:lysozyme